MCDGNARAAAASESDDDAALTTESDDDDAALTTWAHEERRRWNRVVIVGSDAARADAAAASAAARADAAADLELARVSERHRLDDRHRRDVGGRVAGDGGGAGGRGHDQIGDVVGPGVGRTENVDGGVDGFGRLGGRHGGDLGDLLEGPDLGPWVHFSFTPMSLDTLRNATASDFGGGGGFRGVVGKPPGLYACRGQGWRDYVTGDAGDGLDLGPHEYHLYIRPVTRLYFVRTIEDVVDLHAEYGTPNGGPNWAAMCVDGYDGVVVDLFSRARDVRGGDVRGDVRMALMTAIPDGFSRVLWLLTMDVDCLCLWNARRAVCETYRYDDDRQEEFDELALARGTGGDFGDGQDG